MAQTRPIPKEEIAGLEFKHAMYSRDIRGSDHDLLTIKEVIHTKDGRKIPHLHFVQDFKKDFYVTREGNRVKDAQKKEWEDKNKLQKFTSTQAALPKALGKALGRPGTPMNFLKDSPYVYGTDIATTVLMRKKYRDRFPNVSSENTVAVLDIETDVVHGTEEPILVAITFKNKAYLAGVKSFFEGMANPAEKIQQRAQELIGEVIEKRGIELEVEVVDNPGIACHRAVQKAHDWMPDFLAVWNIDFDIPRIEKTLIDYDIKPWETFSDPRVPDRFKFFKYKRGLKQKTTASGMVSSVHPADQWHTAECPASFHLIDSMCVYKRIRAAKANENSYSLDYLLDKHLGIRKLKFKECDHLTGLDWHVEMQTNFKLEYSIYNIFDCIGVEMFDEKVKDLAVTINVLSGISDYNNFNSQPRRLIDGLYFFVQEEYDKVISTRATNMDEDLDKYVVDMRGWVITLPSHLTVNNGICAIEEFPDVHSMIRLHNADLDVSAAYPHAELLLNISKETTARELGGIKDGYGNKIDELTKRYATINLSASHVNAVEIAYDIWKAPSLDTLLNDFKGA